ncbi:murein hydrolase activator EnvC family protein [Marinithermus hydrothermalis]|uniref:Peptidase M23 n=1 Tax=Marinithermus hydrothermalis (strain DSM 14884 / JCM 11576 / T1) TaxID=869210 RepID=F2NQS4_MARHT|nr:peptidoglycan DD-metalloendopeptidase family protein [Marinithermus hydrothermalis]AEB12288.1 Peptidase M23 [Marinithermus hydrothermalis DSM 14884]
MKRLILALFLLLPGLGLGQSLEALQRALQEAEQLKQQRLHETRALEEALAQLDAESRALAERLAQTEAEVTRLERERKTLEREIAALEQQVARVEGQIAAAETRLQTLKARMQQLVLTLHRERAGRYLPLLQARSFTDLIVRARWIQYLGQRDVELVEELKALIAQLEASRKRLVALVQELNAKQAEHTQQLRALEAKRGEYQATLQALNQRKEAQQVRLAELLKAQEQLDQELARLQQQIQAERRRLEAERQKRQESARPVAAVFKPPQALVGRLLFPVAGGRIARAYGTDGQDYEEIQAPKPAAPVRAAADGQVFVTFYYGNLGWLVMIQHTDNLYTLYHNLQDPLVEIGERVEQGQLIGYLGGGALIPPDVLWFRVALEQDGAFRYVDPALYY